MVIPYRGEFTVQISPIYCIHYDTIKSISNLKLYSNTIYPAQSAYIEQRKRKWKLKRERTLGKQEEGECKIKKGM